MKIEIVNKKDNTTFNLSQFSIGSQALKNPKNLALKVLTKDSIEKTQSNKLPSHWTYEELDIAIRSIGHGLLNSGIKPGDFLPLRLTSDTPFALTFFGAISVGIIPVPLSPQLTAKEVAFFLNDTNSKHIAHSDTLPIPSPTNHSLKILSEKSIIGFIEQSNPAPYANTKTNDPAFLIYSSGTTSKPKGVLHAHRVIKGRLPMRDGWHQMMETDKVLHAGEFNWTYTLGVGLMDPWLWGATALIYSAQQNEKKSPSLWTELIKTHQPTIFAAVPGVYRQILKYASPTKQDMSSLRFGLSAGESLRQTLHDEWYNQTGKKIYEALGQSEISTYASTSEGIKIPKSAKGRIQKNRKIEILKNDDNQSNATLLPPNQEGLIAIHKSDPGLMLGYWNREDEMKNSFIGDWFITGDRGIIDEHQNLSHFGRSDDILNVSGYRVAPEEIETSLENCPEISEAAVYEKQVRGDLSILVANIIPAIETTEITEIIPRIKSYLDMNLAQYKHPKSFYIVDKLPRNRAGKLIRSKLNQV